MTVDRLCNFKSHLNFVGSRYALCVMIGVVAATVSGCIAASLAPLALQALGFGVKAGTMMAHGGDTPSPDETELNDQTTFSDSDFDRNKTRNTSEESKCNEMVLVTPAIIQFRSLQPGTEWRELGLGGSADAPRWTVVAAADTPTAKDVSSNGWAPANNLNHMNFTPPLKTPQEPGDDTFMAYAPVESYSAAERDQLASLVLDFGPVVGTFDYNGRQYKYSTLKDLPCFPIPR
jgi:hypothetical protein